MPRWMNHQGTLFKFYLKNYSNCNYCSGITLTTGIMVTRSLPYFVSGQPRAADAAWHRCDLVRAPSSVPAMVVVVVAIVVVVAHVVSGVSLIMWHHFVRLLCDQHFLSLSDEIRVTNAPARTHKNFCTVTLNVNTSINLWMKCGRFVFPYVTANVSLTTSSC